MFSHISSVQDTFRKAARIVSCRDNPFDMRPAVSAIVEEIEARLPHDNKPLVVLMGESHNRPVHTMLQNALLSALYNREDKPSMAVGVELPHNLLETIIEAEKGFKIPSHLRGRISRTDKDGQKFLHASLLRSTYSYSHFTNQNLWDYCRNRQISFRTNDAAFLSEGWNSFLDASDPQTRTAMVRYAPVQSSRPYARINSIGTHGVMLRNHMIVDHAAAHIQQSGASIYIQKCGRDHIFGTLDKRIPLRSHAGHSLSALFNARGYDVLPVYVTGRGGLYKVPDEAAGMADQSIIIEGLSNQRIETSDRIRHEKVFFDYVCKQSAHIITAEPQYNFMIRPLERFVVRCELQDWIHDVLGEDAKKVEGLPPDRRRKREPKP